MRAKALKTTYVRAGTYSLAGVSGGCGTLDGLELSAADTGETWSYYPPDGPASAILDGGSSVGAGICINGSGGVTINGLQIQNFVHTEIWVYDPNVTITNNVLHDNSEAAANGLITAGGPNFHNATITNNVLYNSLEHGIRAATCSYAGCSGGSNNLWIANNYIYNTCTSVGDCGAIYLQDYQIPRSTGIVISNNYVRDVHIAGPDGRGIYLDDGASNTKVNGNIVVGAAVCFAIHGGTNDVFTGNLCDEATRGKVDILLYQDSGCRQRV